MNPLDKVRYCLIANTFLLTTIIFLVFTFAGVSKYFRAGPNEDFVIISVPIYNYERYLILLFFITLMNITKVVIQEIGEPVLLFNIYNPDKKIIDDFTKRQLQFYGNAMFIISNVRSVFNTMIIVTQMDIAFFSVIIEQMTSIVTIRMLVNEKKFIKKTCSSYNLEREHIMETCSEKK